MRLYVPAGLDLLRTWASAGTISGHVEPYVAEDEDEASEYAALVAAAEESRELVGEGGRRVVVVVDVPAETDALPFDRVAAVHADLPGARPGDDLGWYATQEVADLLRG